MTNLDSVFKSRDITFLKEVCVVKVVIFPVEKWMWQLDQKESWVPKNWCFWIVMLEKTLRVPWTARRSNQSILMEINSEYSLEGLMLKLKLQYLGLLMQEQTHWKRPRCWERLKAREGDNRGWDGWMASPTQWTWVWAISARWWWTGKPRVLQSMGLQSWTWLSGWTELNQLFKAIVGKGWL